MQEPERTIACAFATDSGVQPPVNIEELARRHVDLEHVAIPRKVDGLLLRRNGKRPLVLISTNLAADSSRYRFTLAHELGHLIIPWQLGTSLCHVDEQGRLNIESADGQEAEANKFAAELLVPTKWAAQEYAKRNGPLAQHILQIATRANVSPSVAMFAVRRVARPGTILLIHDGKNVVHAAASPHSGCSYPNNGDGLTKFQHQWAKSQCQVFQTTIGPRYLLSVEYPECASLPQIDPEASSKALIKGLLENLVPDLVERRSLLGRINGLVSTCNVDAYKTTEEHMYAGLLRKFEIRGNEIGPVVNQPRFKEYLALKARELTSPKPKKQ